MYFFPFSRLGLSSILLKTMAWAQRNKLQHNIFLKRNKGRLGESGGGIARYAKQNTQQNEVKTLHSTTTKQQEWTRLHVRMPRWHNCDSGSLSLPPEWVLLVVHSSSTITAREQRDRLGKTVWPLPHRSYHLHLSGDRRADVRQAAATNQSLIFASHARALGQPRQPSDTDGA